MSTFYLGEIARLPVVYRQEIELAYRHCTDDNYLEGLVTAEKRMLEAVAELEIKAAEIWGRYAM